MLKALKNNLSNYGHLYKSIISQCQTASDHVQLKALDHNSQTFSEHLEVVAS